MNYNFITSGEKYYFFLSTSQAKNFDLSTIAPNNMNYLFCTSKQFSFDFSTSDVKSYTITTKPAQNIQFNYVTSNKFDYCFVTKNIKNINSYFITVKSLNVVFTTKTSNKNIEDEPKFYYPYIQE